MSAAMWLVVEGSVTAEDLARWVDEDRGLPLPREGRVITALKPGEVRVIDTGMANGFPITVLRCAGWGTIRLVEHELFKRGIGMHEECDTRKRALSVLDDLIVSSQ